MKKILLIILSSVLLAGCFPKVNKNESVKKNLEAIDKTTPILSIINSSQFVGFGQFIFPTQQMNIDGKIQLNEVDVLLPYHNYIQAKTSVEVIQYMKNQT